MVDTSNPGSSIKADLRASDRLKSILDSLDLSRRRLALEAGLAPTSLDYYFTERYKREKLPADVVAEIETPLLRRGVDEHDIWALTEIGQRPQLRAGAAVLRVSLVGVAQADYWGPPLNLSSSDHPLIELPIAIRRLHGYQQTFLVEVRGPSMNLKFPSGTLAECVSPQHLTREIEDGDYLLIEVENKLGQRELTLRQLEIRDDGRHWLWPRSDDPRHQQPHEIPPIDEYHPQGTAIQIHGIVVFIYAFPPK